MGQIISTTLCSHLLICLMCFDTFWCILIRFDTFWCVLIRFDTFWCVLMLLHQTFCHSDAPVSDAYRPPPFHIWKWWPPLTTKAPTAWHQLALSNSVTTQALYCTVLYYLCTILSFWSHGPIQACGPIFAYPIWNWLHISSFINSLSVLHTAV